MDRMGKMTGTLRDLTLEDIARLIQEQPIAIRPAVTRRPAAVLVPLVWQDGRWSLLYTRRAETLANHKGQVSFPGGAVDPQDTSPEETALREAQEEIGLLPGDVRILGRLGYLQTVSDFLITPVVGQIRWPYHFRVSSQEVSRVFTIPMDWLADLRNRVERPRVFPDGHIENIIYFKPYDGEILWGASARITVELLKILRIA